MSTVLTKLAAAPKVKICRISSRLDGVFSAIIVNNLPIAVSLERPWLDNRKGESCIPAGNYLAKRVISPKFGDTFEITGVPGRGNILFHAGNIMEDSHGCVILGESFNIWTTGQCSVASSKVAFAEFMQRLVGINEFPVEIANYF
jgi:hypothetical protein